MTSQSLHLEEKFLLSEKWEVSTTEKINVITVGIVFLFYLILILFEEHGIVVLPQLRNKDPLAEWTVLSLLENSAEAVVGGRKNYFFLISW